jgi:hypothetical protein
MVTESLKLKLLKELTSGEEDFSQVLRELQAEDKFALDPTTFQTLCDEASVYVHDFRTFTTRVKAEEAKEENEASAITAALNGELQVACDQWSSSFESDPLQTQDLVDCYGTWIQAPIDEMTTLSSSVDTSPRLLDIVLRSDDNFYSHRLVEEAEARAPTSHQPVTWEERASAKAAATAASLAEVETRHSELRNERAAQRATLMQKGRAAAARLYPLAVAHSSDPAFAADLLRERALRRCSDMAAPHEWYPAARLMRRKVIYHGGPTNSGKTYHALQALRKANPERGGGVFCGPLRLLALEVFD